MSICSFKISIGFLAIWVVFSAAPIHSEELIYDPANPEESKESLAEAIKDQGGQESDKETKQRTPPILSSFASSGELQRGMPPIANPSLPSLSELRLRFGTFLDAGVGYEIGNVDDDWIRDLDDLLDDFENLEDRTARFRSDFDQGVIPPPAELDGLRDDLINFQDRANRLVTELASEAYAKLVGNASFPFTPMAVRSDTLRGMLSLNADGFVEARGGVFQTNDAFAFGLQPGDEIRNVRVDNDTEVLVVERNGVLIDVPIEAEPDAGIAAQGGTLARIGAGYSRPFMQDDRGSLLIGATLNFYHANLVRAGILFDTDDVSDEFDDAFDDAKSTSNFGIDIGGALVRKNYLIGGVVRNINEPSFDYPDTSGSDFFNRVPHARRNGEKWRMDRQLTIQGALFSDDKRWIATAAVDLNSATDTTGDDYQWAAILGSFEPTRTWVPSPRIGVRTNLTGEKITYVTGGLTFFRTLHIDLASSVETVKVDGNTVPRGTQLNVALGRRF